MVVVFVVVVVVLTIVEVARLVAVVIVVGKPYILGFLLFVLLHYLPFFVDLGSDGVGGVTDGSGCKWLRLW